MNHPAGGGEDWDEREALGRLRYAHGPLERRAALLALLLEPGNAAEAQAWEAVCAGLAGAERWRDAVARLGPRARLPVFEALLERACTAPAAERADLVETARGVMGVDGRVRPLDLLRWLVLRERLAGTSAAPRAPRAAHPPAALAGTSGELLAHAAFEVLTGFLTRLLPEPPEAGVPGPAQLAWGERALEASPSAGLAASPSAGDRRGAVPLAAAGHVPSATGPIRPTHAASAAGVADCEGVLRALRTLQAESWMRRPLRLRAWIDALPAPGPLALEPPAAEALCLCATLLDVPRPAGLAARYLVAPLG
jgi:hypothetical protein